jgi:hypothetical protein
MDTDSAYMAISGETLEAVIREDRREEFYSEWDQWLPAEVCDKHKESWIRQKVLRLFDEPKAECCKKRQLCDKRTPGLFKLEWIGDGIIALSSKSYMCFNNEDNTKNKVTTKGLSKRLNDLRKEHFSNVLKSSKPCQGENRSFRMYQGQMLTYTQVKTGLSYFYGKRKVKNDGISTEPTDM